MGNRELYSIKYVQSLALSNKLLSRTSWEETASFHIEIGFPV